MADPHILMVTMDRRDKFDRILEAQSAAKGADAHLEAYRPEVVRALRTEYDSGRTNRQMMVGSDGTGVSRILKQGNSLQKAAPSSEMCLGL